MADAARHIPRMTAEEYLRVESQSMCRHEFVDGLVYAMVGASRRHNTIALDIRGLLRTRLTAPCQPYALEVKVQVKTQLTDRFYYPDVVVSCSELDDDAYIVRQPVLIIEVSSESTRDFDRGEKFSSYRLIPSLQEYLLVEQDEPKVDLYRKRTHWQSESCGAADELMLESVNVQVPVSAFYP